MGRKTEGFHPVEPVDAAQIVTREYAQSLDRADPLHYLRDEFIIPTKADLKRKTLRRSEKERAAEECIYLCGNSLGLQPKIARHYIEAQLNTWSTKGVHGHFKEVEGSPLTPWLQLDEAATKEMSKIVGAQPSEVAVMQTLTANIHLLLASFYRPTKDKNKIVIEGKAFPSDHYAVQSHLIHHGFDPEDAMITVGPSSPKNPCLSQSDIYDVIDKAAPSIALILLPGIQYYTGQLFDIERITHEARSKGIIVGWDLAHAVGNVPLQLHDWNVDFAVWCTYKYLNCGPGAIGGLFVHNRHGKVHEGQGLKGYRPRLAGWWGSHKETRFDMDNNFAPIPGAAGFQLSNPSALDLSAVLASMSVFAKTDMHSLRQKSTMLTSYLEYLLIHNSPYTPTHEPLYKIITPTTHIGRGAQLSIRLEPGLLRFVMDELEEHGVVADERQPDVVRVAPAPLYNSFDDVWSFVQIFKLACEKAAQSRRMTRDYKG